MTDEEQLVLVKLVGILCQRGWVKLKWAFWLKRTVFTQFLLFICMSATNTIYTCFQHLF